MPVRSTKSKAKKKASSVSKRAKSSSLLDAQVIPMVSRPFYWDTIHEAVAKGDLNEMRRLSVLAKKLLTEVGAAVQELDKAIGKPRG